MTTQLNFTEKVATATEQNVNYCKLFQRLDPPS